MKKSFLLLKIGIVFLLAGLVNSCNLPIADNVNPDLVKTQIQVILTTETADSEDQAPAFTSVPSITIVPPTSTPELPTEQPLSTETTFPEQTQTSTQPTQIIPSGNPSWIDTFEDGTKFGINPEGYDDGQTRISVENGSLKMVSVTASGWRGWRLTSQKPANYYLQADFNTKDCSASDQFGLVIQSPNYESGFGYYFGITCDGRFAFQKWEASGGLTNLQGWTNDANINAGANQTNILGIHKSGNQFTLFINNNDVATINDEIFSEPGFFGPYIAGINTKNFTYTIDEIAYWLLP
jgi:hypothetical protein